MANKLGLLKMLHRKYLRVRFSGDSNKLIKCLLLLICILLLSSFWPMLPKPADQDLSHFMRNRSLEYYLDNIHLLIEPSFTVCQNLDRIPVVILVTSAPDNFQAREAIRNTWAKELPTFFFLGLHGNNIDSQLVKNYVEAKQFSDMVVFDYHDHYQNLTLKVAFMLHWSQKRCPQAEFVFKTDDDVMVNPWMLKKVLEDNEDADLIGYSMKNSQLHRSEYSKWHIPKWLFPESVVPEYLSGTGYIISGYYVGKILRSANKIPLINLEDIYFTYLVAKKELKLELTDDKRLSHKKPLFPLTCAYWSLASAHHVDIHTMIKMWPSMVDLSKSNDSEICWFYNRYLKLIL